MYSLVKKHKIKNDKVPYNPVIDFAIRHLEHPAENVRSAAIFIIGECYRNLGDVVRYNLGGVRPAIGQLLEDMF